MDGLDFPLTAESLSSLADQAWRTPPVNDQAPVDVWWDTTKDAWLDGFETGYRAAEQAALTGREPETCWNGHRTPECRTCDGRPNWCVVHGARP